MSGNVQGVFLHQSKDVMDIRPAETKDIPAIIELLKVCLGEELIPKSEAYWRWKHIDNPFGVSPVLLAFSADTLIGVRAFMHWKWQADDQIYQTVRAVDTATHPAHQGKGIFKKLTLMLLEECKKEGIQFVFNTPNKNSKPGYLKMGWQEAGKLAVSFRCNKPLSFIMHATGLKKFARTSNELDINGLSYFLDNPSLAALLEKDRSNQPLISTQRSVEYLRWRYQRVKVVDYYAAGVETDNQLRALVLYRIKPGKAGNEMRITDIFLESAKYRQEVTTLISNRVKLHNAEYMTVSGTHRWILNDVLSLHGLKIGPVVTIRNVVNAPMQKLHHFREWSPSLGDLELF
jgi:N-acetylglutamate synthase-like GNAT family acetyltransferase